MNNLVMFFSFQGPFNINKWSFLGTSKGDFGVKAPPPSLPAKHFRDIDGYSNQPTGSNLLALFT